MTTVVWQTNSGTLTTANNGSAVSLNVYAFSTNSAMSYSVIAGTLPSGLTLAPNGILSGTLSGSTSTYTFTVRANDGSTTKDATFSYTVTSAFPLSKTFGYIVDGSLNGATGGSQATQKLTMSTELFSSSPNLTTYHYHAGVHGTTNTIGWVSHGQNMAGGPLYPTSGEKLTYSTENWSASPWSSTYGHERGSGFYNGTYFWAFSGTSDGSTSQTSLERVTFSNDAFSTRPTVANRVTDASNGVGTDSFGYTYGGILDSNGSYGTNIVKLDYNTELTSVPVFTLTTARRFTRAIFNGSMNWMLGHWNSNTAIERHNLSTDVLASITATMSIVRSYTAPISGATAGFVSGGNVGVGSYTLTEKLNYATEVLTTSGNLITTRMAAAGL